MADKQQTLEKLITFRQKDKFSNGAWEKRGLNRSDNDTCERLQKVFNGCADNLIEVIANDKNLKQLKATLKKSLASVDSFHYDTEERAFICDYFDELAKIVSVDFNDNISKWMYGSFLNTLFKVTKFFKGKEKIIRTLSQDCTKCKAKLETFILKTEDGIPDHSWNIIQCKNCMEYNLQSIGANIKQSRIGNYTLVEQLPKIDFTLEQANIRLEQIKHFRRK